MGKGFVIAEQGHVVQMIIPADVTAAVTSEVMNMENWGHATILVHGGAGSALTITVSDADSFAASGATMVFRYAIELTAAGDTATELAWATTAGVALGTATGDYLIIEVDADELGDGFNYLMINASAAGTKILGAMAVLSGGRFQKNITDTVIV